MGSKNYRCYKMLSLSDEEKVLALLEEKSSVKWGSGRRPTEHRHYDPCGSDNSNTLIIDLDDNAIGDDCVLFHNPSGGHSVKKTTLTMKGFVAFATKHFPKE